MFSRKSLEKDPLSSIFHPIRTLSRIVAHATNPDLQEYLDELNRSWDSPSLPHTGAIQPDDRTATPSSPQTFPSSPTDSGSDASSDRDLTPEREGQGTVRTPEHFLRTIRETGPRKRPRVIDSDSTRQSMGTPSKRMPTSDTCEDSTSISCKK